MIRLNILIGILLLSVPHFFARREKKTEDEISERLAHLFCQRIPYSCPTSGISFGDPICGYDYYHQALKTFQHECDLVKENCELKTRYLKVEMKKCKARDGFLKMFGNKTVDWAHGHDGFNITIMNFTEPMKIYNASKNNDFFKLIPGLVNKTLRKGKTIL